jgi:ElaB/YqjD/DUF883 family membrane-anchored ribosome-binding protein
MRIWINVLAAACLGSFFATTVLAADQAAGRGACRADVEKLCKDVERGHGGIAKCLKDNEAQLSPECKQHLTQMQEHMHARMQEFAEACKGDVEQYCKDAQPGHGRIGKCLKENEAKLSQACKDQMAQMHGRREQMQKRMHEMMEACTGDADQYCKDIHPGGGRLLKCLKQNEAQLSEGCKSALQPK